MLRLLLISTIFSGSLLWGANAKRVAGYGNLPLRFEPNRGQTDGEARFLARGNGYALFLTQSGAVLSLKGGSALRMSLAGGRGGVLQGSDALGGASNYFIGNDRSKWVTDVPHYGKVRHAGAWEGVDVVYYGNQGKLEYDFVVAPGADPGRIRLRFEGQKALRIDAGGDLVLTLPGGGEMRQLAAVVYQETGGRRTAIRGRYVLRGRGEVSVAVDEYDRSKPLVVDPVLVYSTYLGGSGFDSGNAIAVDSAGNAYVAGETDSPTFPGGGPSLARGRDAYVTKLNAAGDSVVFTTFLAGSQSDSAKSIALDSSGNIYVGGATSSPNFPLQSALYSAGAGFVSKLNAVGGIVFSTKFVSAISGLAVDSSGNCYLTGTAAIGESLPTVNAYQAVRPTFRQVAFVTKANSSFSALAYSTYLGGTDVSTGVAIAVDSLGAAWVTGNTYDNSFPTMTPRQGTFAGSSDVFVSKFSPTGQLSFSTFLGGTGYEWPYGVGVDSLGNAYVTGYTQSTNFPTRNAAQAFVFTSAFVTAYSASGDSYIYSTSLGGGYSDHGYGIAVAPNGSVAVVGSTGYAYYVTYPLASPIQATHNGAFDGAKLDAFVSRLTPTGTISFFSLLGGLGADTAQAVALDNSGSIYITGQTESSSFPIVSAIQSTPGDGTDAFVTKIGPAAQTCSFLLSQNGSAFPAAGGNGSFTVTTGPTCSWAATSTSAGITITNTGNHLGSGAVNFQLAANTALSPRIGTIALTTTVSGEGYAVRQDGTAGSCPAGPITIGQTVSGTLSTTDCRSIDAGNSRYADLYTFTAVAGQQVVIEGNSATVFTRLAIYSPDGSQLSTATNPPVCSGFPFCTFTNGDTRSRIPPPLNSNQFLTLPKDGIYVIEITGGGGTDVAVLTGSYTLKLSAPPPPLLRFVAMPPCRVMETRSEYNFEGRTGSFGPPFLAGGTTRTLAMTTSNVCSIPSRAKAYVLNLTVVPRGGGGVDSVTVFPAGDTRPNFHSIRSPDALVVANSAIVKAGTSNGISVYASNDTDMLIDINGYFTDDTSVPNLVYYPLTPCRVIDTRVDYRSPAGPFGPPTMERGETRRFRFPATPYCTVPSGAAAYSVTLTAAPPQPLAFITAWPSGQSQPNVSNINSVAGRTLANNIVVPASADGSIDVFAYDRTDFLIDINGYFAADNGSGLYYTPVPQCRILDTAGNGFTGAFGAPAMGNDQARTIPVASATTCSGLSANAKAWVVNATALPGGSPMPFLTMFPTGASRPNASQLNAFNGQVVTNTAIVPAGANGSIDVYTYRQTNLLLDISGYFGR